MEFHGQLRIANFVSVKIDHAKASAVLHFAFAQVVELRLPLAVLLQIFRHAFGEQNVPGIAAIHDPLRHVNAGPGDVGAAADIRHFAHRTAMNPHPDRDLGVLLERLRNLDRTLHRFLRIVAKDQRHPIPGRKPDELLVGRLRHLRSRQHDVGQLAHALLLLVDQELGIAHQVEEKYMPDLEAKIALRVRCHASSFR